MVVYKVGSFSKLCYTYEKSYSDAISLTLNSLFFCSSVVGAAVGAWVGALVGPDVTPEELQTSVTWIPYKI